MPTYAYACTACDHRFDAVQSFSDDALTECPECSGRLRKVFSSVGVVFKGSGFYKTDNASARSSSSSSSAGASGGSEGQGTSSSSTPASSGAQGAGSSGGSGAASGESSSTSSLPAPASSTAG